MGGVSPSGATAHLGRLRDGGLVTDEVVGRQRVFRLASPELAEAFEALALVAPPVPIQGLRQGAGRARDPAARRRRLRRHPRRRNLARGARAWPDGATAGAAQLRPRMRRLDRAAAARGGSARRRNRDRLLRPRVSVPPARRAGPSWSRPPERTGSSAAWVSPGSV